jgi:hypothetical protein
LLPCVVSAKNILIGAAHYLFPGVKHNPRNFMKDGADSIKNVFIKARRENKGKTLCKNASKLQSLRFDKKGFTSL